MAKYMTGWTKYDTVELAEKSGVVFSEFVVLEKHNDGTASIVYLQNVPRQPGQVEYKPN